MKRHFYIFLCMLLGVILLLIIQRSLIAIYIIVSDSYPAYDFLTSAQLQMFNWGSAIAGLIVGLIYGNYLGHHWYSLVYGGHKVSAGSDIEPQQKTVTVKAVRTVRAKVSLKSEIRDHGWDFDDLLNKDAPAVESLGSTGPAISSAVSLGEGFATKPVRKIKKVVVHQTKPAAKPKIAKAAVKTVARKSAAKKATTKVKVKK